MQHPSEEHIYFKFNKIEKISIMNNGAVDKAACETETRSSVIFINFYAESQTEIILQL